MSPYSGHRKMTARMVALVGEKRLSIRTPLGRDLAATEARPGYGKNGLSWRAEGGWVKWRVRRGHENFFMVVLDWRGNYAGGVDGTRRISRPHQRQQELRQFYAHHYGRWLASRLHRSYFESDQMKRGKRTRLGTGGGRMKWWADVIGKRVRLGGVWARG